MFILFIFFFFYSILWHILQFYRSETFIKLLHIIIFCIYYMYCVIKYFIKYVNHVKIQDEITIREKYIIFLPKI